MNILYHLRRFKKIIWIDPNNTISLELSNFQYFFGTQHISHYKCTQDAIKDIEKNTLEKYLIMMSSKVFMPEGKQFTQFTKFSNVYPQCIIFCGKKHKVILSKNAKQKVFRTIDDHFKVIAAVSDIEGKINQGPSKSKGQYKFILLSNKQEGKDQMGTIIVSQIKQMLWDSYEIAQLSVTQFQETAENFDPNISKCIIFSFHEEFPMSKIENMLENYQSINNWVILYDETKENLEFEYDSGFTIESLKFTDFKQKIASYIKKVL